MSSLAESMQAKGVKDISEDVGIKVCLRALESAIFERVVDELINANKENSRVNLASLPHNINTATLCIVREFTDDMLTKGMEVYAQGAKRIEEEIKAEKEKNTGVT